MLNPCLIVRGNQVGLHGNVALLKPSSSLDRSKSGDNGDYGEESVQCGSVWYHTRIFGRRGGRTQGRRRGAVVSVCVID